MSTQTQTARTPGPYPHVTLSKDASIIACDLRGQSHESLACHAANLTVGFDQMRDDYAKCIAEREDLIHALRWLLLDYAQLQAVAQGQDAETVIADHGGPAAARAALAKVQS